LRLAKYRSKLQIVAEILEIVKGGAKKTHIMYRANLSYKLLCKYLDEVLECGLVRVDREDSYAVAPKGEKFLQQFNTYLKRQEHVKKELRMVDEEKALLEQTFTSLRDKDSGKRGRLTGKGLNLG
jgi:predicted transcriptional regulator